MDAQDRRTRAVRAEQLLGDEVLSAALAGLETAAIDALASADLSDERALQRHTARLQAARELRADLHTMIRDGQTTERVPLAVA